VRQQLGELLREVVGRGGPAVALEREGRHRIGSRRAADAEVDPLGIEPGEQREALGHLERRVVREHDAAAADAEALRGRGDGPDEHFGTRPGEGEPVMLGQPVALEAQAVGEAREVERVAQRLGAGGALRHRRLVEDAESQGGHGEKLALAKLAPCAAA
jgi:hypothetical protein